MAFTHDDLAELRPYLFHLTSRQNLARIRQRRVLESASRIATSAGRSDLLDVRRRTHVTVHSDGEIVVLRDQRPLHKGNMRLDASWSFGRFVRHLNDRVFFWPGGPGGPNSYGLRHFERYKDEAPAILRLPFTATIDANRDNRPLFCRYNSGSPRWSRGIPSPRGASTFVAASDAAFGPAQVVEVTIPDLVLLPDGVMIADHPHGPWEPL